MLGAVRPLAKAEFCDKGGGAVFEVSRIHVHRGVTGRDCSGTFHVKDHAFPSSKSWPVQAAEHS